MSSPTTTLARPKLVPTAQASLNTGIPVYRLRAMAERGMPCVHIGRKLYFDLDVVDVWIAQNITSGEPIETSITEPEQPADDWVAAQVAKFSPDDLRRAGELLLALSKGASTSAA